MSDFLNFFDRISKNLKKDPSEPKNIVEKNTKAPDNPDDLAKQYREAYAEVEIDVLRKLNELKDITKSPKTNTPDKPFAELQSKLGDPEVSETLRQERWGKTVNCPFCKSKDIKKLPKEMQDSEFTYKYECLNCGKNFNDDTETDMEGGIPPLRTWMLCWYLFGCTTSIQYIATKLGLDAGVVEIMIQYMQKLFNAEQPLTNFMTFEEWSQKYGKNYKAMIKASLVKQEVLRGLDTARQPGDTGEYRKQKDKNRGPKPKPRT